MLDRFGGGGTRFFDKGCLERRGAWGGGGTAWVGGRAAPKNFGGGWVPRGWVGGWGGGTAIVPPTDSPRGNPRRIAAVNLYFGSSPMEEGDGDEPEDEPATQRKPSKQL